MWGLIPFYFIFSLLVSSFIFPRIAFIIGCCRKHIAHAEEHL
jgi:hypothetical protein